MIIDTDLEGATRSETETLLMPGVAVAPMVMFTPICALPFTWKLLTTIPSPKLTLVVPVKLAPVMTTSKVCPCVPWSGLIDDMAGAAVNFL